MTEEILAKEIIKHVGGSANICKAQNCMTRLRLVLNDQSTADTEALSSLPGVLGVKSSDTELQIILGPGKAAKVTNTVNSLLSSTATSKKAEILHQKIKDKNSTPIKLFFKHIADIFIPLIPAFIACGLINGMLNVVKQLDPEMLLLPIMKIFSAMGQSIFAVIHIFVGLNAAKEFGGTPAISGILSAFISLPALADISIFNITIVPGRGGIIAILLISAFASVFEKKLHSLLPQICDFFLTPFLTFVLSCFLALFVFQPTGSIISNAIKDTTYELINSGGAATGFIMAGSFLPFVMMGIHHILTPIHAELIAKTGLTILLPIFAMAGAGQIGAAFAVLRKTNNQLLKKTILTSLPIAFMGIGEPLIYGVTLPLVKPFIGACIGAAFGGAVEAYYIVGSNTIGISGLPLTAATDKPLIYLTGTVIAYITAFFATTIIGFEDLQEKPDKE